MKLDIRPDSGYPTLLLQDLQLLHFNMLLTSFNRRFRIDLQQRLILFRWFLGGELELNWTFGTGKLKVSLLMRGEDCDMQISWSWQAGLLKICSSLGGEDCRSPEGEVTGDPMFSWSWQKRQFNLISEFIWSRYT